VGEVIDAADHIAIEPFNGAVEIGLRALAILAEAFPDVYSLQRLVIFDYFVVHSDDVVNGPLGLHPKTPYRSGELLIRRGILQQGLSLYASRGLIQKTYIDRGVYFGATDVSAQFLDALGSTYARLLRDRATWVVQSFGGDSDEQIERIANDNLGKWGAEFVMQSVLWEDTRDDS
jgi:hypothetical protein